MSTTWKMENIWVFQENEDFCPVKLHGSCSLPGIFHPWRITLNHQEVTLHGRSSLNCKFVSKERQILGSIYLNFQTKCLGWRNLAYIPSTLKSKILCTDHVYKQTNFCCVHAICQIYIYIHINIGNCDKKPQTIQTVIYIRYSND